MQPRLLLQRVEAGADVDVGPRAVRQADGEAVGAAVDGGGGFHRVLHQLEAGPDAGIAAHGDAEEAVVDDVLHAGRREDGDDRVDHPEFGLVGGGGAFAGVVVAHQREHAAERRGAGKVGVAQRIAGAVDAGALAVPEREDAVVAVFAAKGAWSACPRWRWRQGLR